MPTNNKGSIPAELYPIVRSFLSDAGFDKTVKVFQKELGQKVVNDEVPEVDLLKIYSFYLFHYRNSESKILLSNEQSNSEKKKTDSPSSSKKSPKASSVKKDVRHASRASSSDSSSEETSSNEESITEEENSKKNGTNQSKTNKVINSDNSDEFEEDKTKSDGEESSSSDPRVDQMQLKPSSASGKASTSEDSSDNSQVELKRNNETEDESTDSEPSSDEEKYITEPKNQQTTKSRSVNKKSEKEASTSETSTSEDENKKSQTTNIKPMIAKNSPGFELKPTEKDSSWNGKRKKNNVDLSESDSDKNLNKKDKLKQSRPTLKDQQRKGSSPKKIKLSEDSTGKQNVGINTYQRRIEPEKVEFYDERLKNNSFLAKDGAIGSYGHKAHLDLVVTRGRDFRAQKTKKKRGSYRGGKIDMKSHSIKFNFE
ncbi:hypothetical protein G9A89_021532 [Geosiphon pyriformis]|nr:hypothetical protein G9A89_021532 [Geosiphon pyriformis]